MVRLETLPLLMECLEILPLLFSVLSIVILEMVISLDIMPLLSLLSSLGLGLHLLLRFSPSPRLMVTVICLETLPLILMCLDEAAPLHAARFSIHLAD